MDFLTNTLAFVFALGVIIFVHEGGHLLVAKAFDVRVLAFSLGFGKRLFGFKRGETDYRVSLVPLGGYVRLGGENPDEVSDDPREFLNKPRWQRILVYLAGPAMNVVLSIAIMAVLFSAGTSVSIDPGSLDPVVGAVVDGSPAAAVGLEPGDRIVSIGGDAVDDWQDVNMAIVVAPGKPVAIAYQRDGKDLSATVVPEKVAPYGYGDAGLLPEVLPRFVQVLPDEPAAAAGFEAGDEIVSVDGRRVADQTEFVEYLQAHPAQQVKVTVRRGGHEQVIPVTTKDVDGQGKIGAMIGYYVEYSPGEAVLESVRFNWNIAVSTLEILGKIVTRQVSAKTAVSGPIDIASMSGAAARTGFKPLFYLMAVISLSIAIFNLLPIPLLDGGQTTILLIESVRGRDLSLALKERIQQFGFLVIIVLMAAVIVMDITKRLPEGMFGGDSGQQQTTEQPASPD